MFSVVASFETRWLGLLDYSSSWIYRAIDIALSNFLLILRTNNILLQVLLWSSLPHFSLLPLFLSATLRIPPLVNLWKVLRRLPLIRTLWVLPLSLGFQNLHLLNLQGLFVWVKVMGRRRAFLLFDNIYLPFLLFDNIYLLKFLGWFLGRILSLMFKWFWVHIWILFSTNYLGDHLLFLFSNKWYFWIVSLGRTFVLRWRKNFW